MFLQQAISYTPVSPLSFIDEEILILSSFFCKFEISCPPKDIKIKRINVHCHFDRPYSPVSLHICLRKKKLSDSFADNDEQEKESWAGIWGQPVKAVWKHNHPILMNAVPWRGGGSHDDNWSLLSSLKSLLMTPL